MSYFSSVFGLGCLPLPGTIRIASNAEVSYSGDFVLGLIPATIRRCRTVVGFNPRALAISSTVKPSIIYFISVNLTEMLIFFKNFTENLLTKSNGCVRFIE